MPKIISEKVLIVLATFSTLKEKYRVYVSLIFLLLCSFSVIDNAIDFAGRDYINQLSMTFLKDSESHTQETFLLLSAGKGSMAVLESSEAGISFIVDVNVRLGNMISPLKEAFDYAWEFTLGSLSIILLSQMLLNIVDALFVPYLIFIACVWFAYELMRLFKPSNKGRLQTLLKQSSFLLALLFFAFPLAIASTSMFSDVISSQHARNVHDDLNSHNKLFSIDQTKGTSLKDSAEGAVATYKKQRGDIEGHLEKIHKTLYTHIAVGITETIILPLLLLFMFQQGLKFFMPLGKNIIE